MIDGYAVTKIVKSVKETFELKHNKGFIGVLPVFESKENAKKYSNEDILEIPVKQKENYEIAVQKYL